MKRFDVYCLFREASRDWKAESMAPPLKRGFLPPTKLRPIINAFLNSDQVILQADTSDKPLTMPRKSLFICGAAVRRIARGEAPGDFTLKTNATPQQIATILSAAGFKAVGDEEGTRKRLELPALIRTTGGGEHEVVAARAGDKLLFVPTYARSSGEPMAVIVICHGEEFIISTFTSARGDFVDNLADDATAKGKDGVFLELTKADGENKSVYDPGRKDLGDEEGSSEPAEKNPPGDGQWSGSAHESADRWLKHALGQDLAEQIIRT